VILALQAPGKLLSNASQNVGISESCHTQAQAPALPAGVWPLLTLLVAQHPAPYIDPLLAGDVAIAVECFICALDLLDDVEDGDQTSLVELIGIPRMLNVSTTLLMLAQRALLSLTTQGIAPERTLTLRLLYTFQEAALTATEGQHRDLLAEQRPVQDFGQEICIEIAAGKAGALMRLVCLGPIRITRRREKRSSRRRNGERPSNSPAFCPNG
jgi:geranylgeranyl pyrophosphate synthase